MENQARTIKITEPHIADAEGHDNPWLILVIDDVQSVLDVTFNVLKHLQFDGRSVRLETARSGEKAQQLYLRYSNPAVILVDCVMENDTAGLEFVEFVRNTHNNNATQIVLRTGQPGIAPEHDVLEHHQINDYLAKTDLSSAKLRSRVISYLRNYQAIIGLLSQSNTSHPVKYPWDMYALACTVAREIRSPLKQIHQNLKKIRETVPDLLLPQHDTASLEVLYRNLDNSQYAVNYGAKMIDLMLEEGKNKANNSLIYRSAQKLTQQTVTNFTYDNQEYMGRITVEQENDFLFSVDEARYSQMLCRLFEYVFENISQYPDLEITISLQADTDCNKVMVKHNGLGVSKNQLEQLFDTDTIYDVDNEIELGLAYCKRSMNNFNGTINCLSVEGGATEFLFSFPVVLPISDGLLE